jgi:hypothetical protein
MEEKRPENKATEPSSGTKKPSFRFGPHPIIAMDYSYRVGYGIYHLKAQLLLFAAAFLTACLGALA